MYDSVQCLCTRVQRGHALKITEGGETVRDWWCQLQVGISLSLSGIAAACVNCIKTRFSQSPGGRVVSIMIRVHVLIYGLALLVCFRVSIDLFASDKK